MNEHTKYGVWCICDGPTFGHRESWLKDEYRPTTFHALEVAQDKAARLNASMNRPNGIARFSYTAKPIDQEGN